MPERKTYRIIAGLAVIITVIVLAFFVLNHKENGNSGDNTTERSPEREEERHTGLTPEQKLKTKQALYAREIKEFQFEVPEPSYENADIEAGQMFIYGQYLPPPYKVEIVDNRLLLNGISLIPELHATPFSDLKVPPEITKRHEANLLISKMLVGVNLHNDEEANQLLRRIKEMEIVEDAEIDNGRNLSVKYRGSGLWETFLTTRRRSFTKEEKRVRYLEELETTKRDIEERLRKNGVIFWFSKGRFWGVDGFQAEDIPRLAEKISKLLKKPRPSREQTIGDYADEMEQLTEMIPALNIPEIMEIIANWERKKK